MVASRSLPLGEYVATADQRVVMYGVTWAAYEALLALRGDAPVPRIAYLDEAMELMTPSRQHERLKSYIGRLIEVFAGERGIEFTPYGGWTLKEAPKRAGVEPDECYLFGDQNRDTPDLVIEVVWTSGGIDKLEAYRRLGVREVWFWRDGATEIYVLQGDRHQRTHASASLPGLDVAQLTSFLDHPTASQAVKAYRLALAAR